MNKTSSVTNLFMKTTSSNSDGSIIAKNPLFRLYSPSNPVLKEEYSIFFHESYKKITNR